MPQSIAATEDRIHQERSEHFITQVISFVFTPCVIVILLILIYLLVCVCVWENACRTFVSF